MVNGREARATRANLLAWEVELDPTPADSDAIQAHAEDADGNVERTPHVVPRAAAPGKVASRP